MVDVGEKPVTSREAVARGSIAMSREARRIVRAGAIAKGDPLQAARIAGIMAAKQTAALIPLCHPLPLANVHIALDPDLARLRDRGARPHDRPDRGRDGSADGCRRRRADHLRHGQGGRQDDGHRRHPGDVQERRAVGDICTLPSIQARLSLGIVGALAVGVLAARSLPGSTSAAPAAQSPLRAGSAAPTAGYRVVRTYPHDRDAYTQGSGVR